MAIMNAISPLAGGNLWTYYKDKDYPIDLNGALDYMRPQEGVSPFPFPVLVGHVQGLIPLFDAMTFSMMTGREPFGPYIGQGPRNMESVFPGSFGGLSKVGG